MRHLIRPKRIIMYNFIVFIGIWNTCIYVNQFDVYFPIVYYIKVDQYSDYSYNFRVTV